MDEKIISISKGRNSFNINRVEGSCLNYTNFGKEKENEINLYIERKLLIHKRQC